MTIVFRARPGLSRNVEHAADAVVHRLHRREVVLHVALVLPAGQRLAGQRHASCRRASIVTVSGLIASHVVSASPVEAGGGVELQVAVASDRRRRAAGSRAARRCASRTSPRT